MSNRESARRLREGLERGEAETRALEEAQAQGTLEETAPKEETPLSEELQKGKGKKGGMNGS